MSLISDVRSDVNALKSGRRDLRNFGLVLGSAFALLTILGIWKGWTSNIVLAIGAVSVFFSSGAFLFQRILKPIRTGWMTFAFVLGWIISRIILVILYYGVVTPIALTARVTGKKFLSEFKDAAGGTYWITRQKSSTASYKKMH
jgi:hypothetical protein